MPDNRQNDENVSDNQRKELEEWWSGRRFLSDKAIAGKMLMDGQNYATQQDFIDIDKQAKSGLSTGSLDCLREDMKNYGKTMVGFKGCYDSAMIKEEDFTDENGEPCKKYTTTAFGKKSLIVGKNKPAAPADKTSVQLPNISNNLPNLQNQTQIQSLQDNTIPKQQSKQKLPIQKEKDSQESYSNIFANIPFGPNDKENLIRANISEVKSLKWYEKHLNFLKNVRTNGKWDYKQQNPDFQDFGNFHFGVIGMAIGLPEEVLLRGAGAYQQIAGDKVSGENAFWGKTPYGDDPRDQEQIKAGIEWYKKHRELFE